MVTSFVVVAAIALIGGFVKVPYVSLGPGPTYNTLGSIDGQVVVEVDGTRTYPTTGQLRMTTVSINDEITLFDALGKWVSGRYALAGRPSTTSSNRVTACGRSTGSRSTCRRTCATR
jgi:PDZ domain-containing protein